MPPLEYGSNAYELENFHIFYSWKKAFYEIDWLSAKDEQKKLVWDTASTHLMLA